MPKLKPKFKLGLEDGEIFMHTNYPPRGEDAELVGEFLFSTKEVVGKEFPHHKLNFCITAAPLGDEVHWYFQTAPRQSFSVSETWENFLSSLQRMVGRLETFHDFATVNAFTHPAVAIKAFYQDTLEVKS